MRPLHFSVVCCSKFAVVLSALVLLGGCAASKHRQQMTEFSESWATGDYFAAAYGKNATAADPLTTEDLERMDLLELLHLAEAVRLHGDDELSIRAYDQTEEVFRKFDEENVATRTLRQASAVLFNESIRGYGGNLYEAVLVNTYKALSFLSISQPDLARVEFNRADDRTRRAVDYYAKQIEEQQEALEQEVEKTAEAHSVASTMESTEAQDVLFKEYGNPSQWGVYQDFVNPFATYLHGLYFLSAAEDTSDIERAVESLSRVDGMIENSTVARDLELAEGLASGQIKRDELPQQVWLIYENGTGPRLKESRIDIPIFLFTGDVDSGPIYAGIALPKIATGLPAHQVLKIGTQQSDSAVDSVQTEVLAEMERVLRTEFQQGFNGILARSIASAVVHLFIQAEASNYAGLLGSLAATAFTASTTTADLRIWRALPHHWQIARIEPSPLGTVSLADIDDQAIAEVVLPDWPYTLIYVKQPTKYAEPAIRVIDLQGRHGAINPIASSDFIAEAEI